ncbi:MAG: hypothetical protein ACP5NL_04145 [Thermoplasmata archaeon]
MIYVACPVCGFTIDSFSEEDLKSPVREKRLKYLMTRDQVCPNCLTTVGKCQRVEAKEEEIPIFKVNVEESEKDKIIIFSKEHGYSVVTDFTIKQYKGAV